MAVNLTPDDLKPENLFHTPGHNLWSYSLKTLITPVQDTEHSKRSPFEILVKIATDPASENISKKRKALATKLVTRILLELRNSSAENKALFKKELLRKNNEDKNLLHEIACKADGHILIPELLAISKVVGLPDYVHEKDGIFGSTALHFATRSLVATNISTLLQHGANPHLFSSPLDPQGEPRKPDTLLFDNFNARQAACIRIYLEFYKNSGDKKSWRALKDQMLSNLRNAAEKLRSTGIPNELDEAFKATYNDFMPLLKIHRNTGWITKIREFLQLDTKTTSEKKAEEIYQHSVCATQEPVNYHKAPEPKSSAPGTNLS